MNRHSHRSPPRLAWAVAFALGACSSEPASPPARTAASQPKAVAPPGAPVVQLPKADLMPAKEDTLASGLAAKILKAGTGEVHPTGEDRVVIQYKLYSADGKLISELSRPQQLPVRQLIRGWQQGLRQMVAGEKRRLWIPAELAYGAAPTSPGAPAGDLIYDLELLDVLQPPPRPALLPPDGATRSARGVAYEVLQPGRGTRKPDASSVVDYELTGWTQAGRLYASHLLKQRPERKPMQGVIPGLADALSDMVAGEQRRLWIPAELGYGPVQDQLQRDNQPAGALVVEVELVRIVK